MNFNKSPRYWVSLSLLISRLTESDWPPAKKMEATEQPYESYDKVTFKVLSCWGELFALLSTLLVS